MAETHELRLKIDAAGAKRGSREFTAAVDAVKRAVRDLERDSTGAFTKLRKNLDTLSKTGKMNIGVDRQAIRNLNDFAAAQQKIVAATSNSSKGIKTLVQTMRGLSDSYAMARKTSEAFATSILKTNSALMRQIQLASQARSAVRQVRTAPTTEAAAPTARGGVSQTRAATRAVRDLEKASRDASKAAIDSTKALGRHSKLVLRSQQDAARALTRSENLHLSSAAAIRRAEQEAVRLSGQLSKIGDTRGVSAVNQALIQLKARLAGGVNSAVDLRKAMDQFSQSTHTAKNSITRFNTAQAAAASESKRVAAAQRAQADAARRTEREMRSLAGANNAASQAMRNATGNLRGLENAFSATFQAGSLFRTMMGTLTLGTFISSVFKAGDALEQFKVSMEIATGSAAMAMTEMDYVDNIASKLGVNLQSARDNYSKFAISANIAGVAASETQKIFESVSTAMAVLGKGTEDQNLAFMALEQMMSKGKVSSEELRRQLGERLPGAVNMMAQALGVGVDELQDLLKAGAINSADALPKFAEVLEKRFAPGLERASRRAGNNLQKLQNEITKFSEEVAQSGFMQELAAQFRILTDELAGGGGVSAAQKLGEALANMARIGGKAASFLIENIDGIGKALKAIGIGIVVRQIGLMGAAVATSAQQLTGYTAAWVSNRSAVAAADAAAVKHSATLTGNSAALARNSVAAKGATMSTAALVRQQEIAVRSAMNARRGFLGLGVSMTTMGTAAATAAGRMGAMARGLSALAPIAGIAVTAIMLIPGAMDAIGLGADKMEVKVNAALSRAGVAFDEFGETIRKTASQAEMARLISDINTLEEAANRLANAGQGRDGILGNVLMDDELALTASVMQLDKDMPGVLKKMNDFGRIISGYESFDESVVGPGAAQAAKSLLEGYLGLTEEQGDAVALQKQLNAAMIQYPSAAPLFTEFEKLINQQVRLEQGISNTQDAMTRLYGTESEKIALEFAEAAKQVIKTGEGVDELNEKQKVLSEMSPEIAKRVSDMRAEFDKAFKSGAAPIELQQTLQTFYSGTADKIMGLRDEVKATEKAFGDATDGMMSKLGETLESLNSMDTSEGFFSGFDGVDPEAIATLEALFGKFNEFQSGGGIQVSAEALANFANALDVASPSAAAFKDELIQQYSALTPTEQTYSRLDSMLSALAAKYPQAAGEISGMTAAILTNAKGTNSGAMAYSDLERAVNSIPWPTDEAAAAARELLGMAQNTQAAGNAADGATGALYAASGGTDAIAAGAANATAQVRALQAALASLGAVAAGVPDAAAKVVDDINFQTRLKTSAVWERESLTFEREQISKLREQRDAALKAEGSSDGPIAAMIQQDYERGVENIKKGMTDIETASKALYDAEAWKDPNKGGKKGGGGKGRGGALSDEQKLVQDLNEDLKKRQEALLIERQALEMVASGQYQTMEAAELMARAMILNGGAVDEQTAAMIRQIDAAAALNEQLQTLANDPVKQWMDSVPNWVEAGQQIEMGAINHLKDAISEFIQTGKFDIESLGQAILGTIADIVSDKAVAELSNLLGRGEGDGLGGLLGGLFNSVGDTPMTMGEGADVAQGGVQAGQSISSAMVQAGQTVSQQLSAAMTQGGMQAGTQVQTGMQSGGAQAANATRAAGLQHATQIRTATTTGGQQHATQVKSAIDMGGTAHASKISTAMMTGGGGGGGGNFLTKLLGGGGSGGGGGDFLSTALSFVPMFFKEGGMTSNPHPVNFAHAPHFSAGTPNTSGIPAVLHDNEAVIPLSKGRKVPVEMGGMEGMGGGNKTVNQTFNITTPDADSFRRSQKQIAADSASSAQKAMKSNR